jgi:hypothetical protein
MRIVCVIAWLAVASGCSSYVVRCDSRLRPINVLHNQQGPARPPTGGAREHP